MSDTKIEPKLQISKKDDIEKHLEPVKDKNQDVQMEQEEIKKLVNVNL